MNVDLGCTPMVWRQVKAVYLGIPNNLNETQVKATSFLNKLPENLIEKHKTLPPASKQYDYQSGKSYETPLHQLTNQGNLPKRLMLVYPNIGKIPPKNFNTDMNPESKRII